MSKKQEGSERMGGSAATASRCGEQGSEFQPVWRALL
jgi:hypothetical protein